MGMRVPLTVGLVGALVLVACSMVGERVVILGDSITALGEIQIHEILDDTYNVAVSGEFGERTDQRIQAARLQAGLGPRQAIVNLGTNDVLQHRPAAQTITNLRQLVAAYEGAHCIFLVTINTRLDQSGNRPHAAAVSVNEGMEQLAMEIPNVELIRWDQIIDEAAPKSLTTDGVHPSAEGQRLLIDAYAAALRDC